VRLWPQTSQRRVLELVSRALEERILVTVVRERERRGQMRSIILHGAGRVREV